jgi:hypothetical protein
MFAFRQPFGALTTKLHLRFCCRHVIGGCGASWRQQHQDPHADERRQSPLSVHMW